MAKTPDKLLGKTLIAGSIYFLITLGYGLFCSASAAGSAGMGDLSLLEIGMVILQPVAAFIAWLGTTRPEIHQHVTLGYLGLISLGWSFVVGWLCARLTTKRA